MTDDRNATSRPLPQSEPFQMPSPFPAPEPRRSSAKLWTIVGIVLGTALATAAQQLLTSHGVPAPVVEGAARAIQDALPK